MAAILDRLPTTLPAGIQSYFVNAVVINNRATATRDKIAHCARVAKSVLGIVGVDATLCRLKLEKDVTCRIS